MIFRTIFKWLYHHVYLSPAYAIAECDAFSPDRGINLSDNERSVAVVLHPAEQVPDTLCFWEIELARDNLRSLRLGLCWSLFEQAR